VVKGRSFVVDTLVQLEIQDPGVPHLDIYDVPGQRASDADLDGMIAPAIGALVERIKAFTCFLLVLGADADRANLSVVSFMRQHGVLDSNSVVGVVTRADQCIPGAAAFDDDDDDDDNNPVVKVAQAMTEACPIDD